MLERFLQQACVELPAPDENGAAARVRLANKFPRQALRRMTHLGLLLGAALENVKLGGEDSLVFASTYAETRALEDYLLSFPSPSPLLFQTSIHPGGVQQVLIGRQQPLARLWPLAGREHAVEQALLTALLEPAARVALVGGEERGTWLLDHGMAAARSFAFAAVLTREPVDALGRVTFAPGAGTPVGEPTLEAFAVALHERQALRWQGAGGTWTLAWR